jgi:hypothetical protein
MDNNNNNDMFSYSTNEDPSIEPTPMIDQSNLNPIEDDNSGRSLVWLILGIVVLGCGAVFVAAFLFFQPDTKSLMNRYFPSPTATFTQTPTSTPTNTPSPTLTSTPTPNMTTTAAALQATDTAMAYQATATNVAGTWRTLVKDTFDSNKNKWQIKPSDDAYALTNYEITNGKYTWDTTAHKAFIGWVTANTKSVSDFYLSADVKQPSGPDSADYGLIFREDTNSNFYYFGINEKGQYALYLYNKNWSTLLDLTQSELIHPGQANRLTVLGEGSHFVFFINDQYLTELTDDTIKSGTTAFAIELANANDHAIFEFDNFELRVPK